MSTFAMRSARVIEAVATGPIHVIHRNPGRAVKIMSGDIWRIFDDVQIE
jgi:hypothetical protein